MQQTSSTSTSFVENLKLLPMSTPGSMADVSSSNDIHYSSLLLKKKLAMLDSAAKIVANAPDIAHNNDMPIPVRNVQLNISSCNDDFF